MAGSVAYWDTQRVVQLGHQARQLWRTSGITDLVIDAIWLCNDLFSVEKDLARQPADGPPVSLNGVLIDARTQAILSVPSVPAKRSTTRKSARSSRSSATSPRSQRT